MEDFSKYKKEDLVELLTYLDRPRESLDSLVMLCCESLSCENCPVIIYNCDYRSDIEKRNQYSSCQEQLYNWMRKEFENAR